MQKRAVVTGGAGFIGSYIVKMLLQEDYEVVVFDNLSTGKKERLPEKATLVVGDVRNYEEISAVISSDDIVFHLAGFISVPRSFEEPLLSNEINLRGTYNVFEAARMKQAACVIFSSSAAVYGDASGTLNEDMPPAPVSPYGLQKYLSEKIAHHYFEAFGLSSICLRYFNVYGEGNNEEGDYAPVTARFLKQRREGKDLTITGDGKQTRDFIHVEDVAKANLLAGEKAFSTKLFGICNISSSVATTVKEIADHIGGNHVYISRRNETEHSLGSNHKAKELIGWEPTITLQEGLKKIS